MTQGFSFNNGHKIDAHGAEAMNHSLVPVDIDHERGVAYINLSAEPRDEQGRVTRSARFHDVVLDFDETGSLVGIELLKLPTPWAP